MIFPPVLLTLSVIFLFPPGPLKFANIIALVVTTKPALGYYGGSFLTFLTEEKQHWLLYQRFDIVVEGKEKGKAAGYKYSQLTSDLYPVPLSSSLTLYKHWKTFLLLTGEKAGFWF